MKISPHKADIDGHTKIPPSPDQQSNAHPPTLLSTMLTDHLMVAGGCIRFESSTNVVRIVDIPENN
jgi:hypothetical protein